MKTKLTHAEMLLFLMGVGIDREEKPNRVEDLVGQTWRAGEDGYVLVEGGDVLDSSGASSENPEPASFGPGS